MTMPPTAATLDLQEPRADRNLLLTLWQRGDRYGFLESTFRYLANTEIDQELVLLAVKALCELGLGVPARELLDQRKDLDRSSPQVAAIRRSIAAVSSGRVDWSDFVAIFECNLNALVESQECPAGLIDALRESLPQMQLFHASDGSLHLSSKPVGEIRQWIPALTDYPQLRNLEAPADELARSVVIVGLTLTNAVERIDLTTQSIKKHGRPPLFILEPDVRRATAWLHVGDRTRLLRDPRIRMFVGSDAIARFGRFLEENEDIEPPAVRVACHAPQNILDDLGAVTHRCRADRNAACASIVASLADRSAQRSPAVWLQRIRPGSTILGITSRFTTMLQYSMRDIGHALEKLGYKFVRLMENDDHRIMSTLTINRAILDHDPSLVVLINHFRREQPQGFGSVPILTWVQDPTNLVLSEETGRSIGELDFVCGYCLTRCVGEFRYPESNFFSAILPVSTTTFHDGPVDRRETEAYECDLMYVGHLHNDETSHIERSREGVSPQLHPLLDAMYAEVRTLHATGEHLQFPRPLVDRIAARLGFPLEETDREKLANFFAYRLFDILYRRQTLHWAARWAARAGRTFKLYGNGWAADPLLAPHAVGAIEHGEPLRKAYRCAKLVLQSMPAGFMHQRSFEGLACGSLVIARFAPESFGRMTIEQFEAAPPHAKDPTNAAVLFPRLKELVFRSEDEFAEVCERCLVDDAYRARIRDEMRAVVLDQLTYEGILDSIIRWIRDGDPAPFNTPHPTRPLRPRMPAQ